MKSLLIEIVYSATKPLLKKRKTIGVTTSA